jgi:hypothetical protein
MTAFSNVNSVVITRTVAVAPASAIPTLGDVMLILLLLSLLAVGLVHEH